MRSINRILGCAYNTIAKLMLEAGEFSAAFHDEYVRNIVAHRIEADELWSFCHSKDNEIWTWTAIDPDTKLLVQWLIGGHTQVEADEFIYRLSRRLATRVQLTTDGWSAYPEAVQGAFLGEVDYAQLVKNRRDPGKFLVKTPLTGKPDPNFISTSIVERQNLNIRMSVRRYARRTNAFSKRLSHHSAMFALYMFYYNFCRPHTSLKNPYPRTPAMAADLLDHPLTLDWLIERLNEIAPAARRPKKYRKSRVSN